MCRVYSLNLLILCWAINVCAMEAPPSRSVITKSEHKVPTSHASASLFTQKVDDAIAQKNVAALKDLLQQIENANKYLEVQGDPNFFSSLHQKAKQELWKLTHVKSDKLIDSREGKPHEPQEAAKNSLLDTQVLFERSKAIQPHDPEAAAVAKDLETKMFEKKVEEETAEDEARQAAARAQRAREVRARLAQDYISVGQKNPDATKESKILDIRAEERAAAAALAQRSWWATFIDWKKYYWG